ncbi:hypothetical protein PanWU01x14_332480 [Parasponia andersonii]|uniref:Uncharacterized protein n=1 Tax=Parasponia andersonii TaxID=3476 RepID=A0A2P5AHB5_PARAD|nr:hypothetical protein PanWU01x14_332480 [Parasponia andersonii]
MQASLSLGQNDWQGFPSDYAEISEKMSQDFGAKLKVEEPRPRREEIESGEAMGLEDRAGYGEEDVEEDGEEEFSFDGQIRPIFPIFDRSLLFADGGDGGAAEVQSLRPPLKKLFVEERDAPSSSSSSDADELEALPPGTYCEWSGKAVEATPELSKKSNSTGFSKFWRFRDLVVRSSSDGKDAFVFLNPNSTSAKQSVESIKKLAKAHEKPSPEKKAVTVGEAAAEKVKVKAKTKRGETAPSAHERYYVRNKAKEVDKRRSYLPYRPDLVGFFANVNGLSRNVHPF